jgi:hypothetical protein
MLRICDSSFSLRFDAIFIPSLLLCSFWASTSVLGTSLACLFKQKEWILIAIDSATLESNPRALKEEYELAGLFHLGLVGLAVGFFSGASESDVFRPNAT